MKKAISAIFVLSIIAFSSCKKCYECTQYCAYCESKADNSVAYKICATKLSGHSRVDSFYNTFADTAFNRIKLQDQQDVCANKNTVDDAAAYYQKQGYYCNSLD